jgi:hypothetical protein
VESATRRSHWSRARPFGYDGAVVKPAIKLVADHSRNWTGSVQFFFRSSKGSELSTSGLGIPHIAPSQSNKVLAVNEGFDVLDGALTQQAVIDVSGGVDVKPAPARVLPFMSLKLVGVLTANIALILPASGHLYLVIHAATGHTVTVRCGSGSSVTLNPGRLQAALRGWRQRGQNRLNLSGLSNAASAK